MFAYGFSRAIQNLWIVLCRDVRFVRDECEAMLHTIRVKMWKMNSSFYLFFLLLLLLFFIALRTSKQIVSTPSKKHERYTFSSSVKKCYVIDVVKLLKKVIISNYRYTKETILTLFCWQMVKTPKNWNSQKRLLDMNTTEYTTFLSFRTHKHVYPFMLKLTLTWVVNWKAKIVATTHENEAFCYRYNFHRNKNKQTYSKNKIRRIRKNNN